MPFLNITLRGKERVEAQLTHMPAVVYRALEQRVRTLILKLQAHVIRDKLSGQVLKVRSGALWRSIQEKVEASGAAIHGRVYSAGDVKYASIHEYGGRTPAHEIYPTKAAALHFAVGGRMVFAKVVHHPGSQMPERSFLRSSLTDLSESISAGLREAASAGLAEAMGRPH